MSKPLKTFAFKLDEDVVYQARRVVDLNEFIRLQLEKVSKTKRCPVCKTVKKGKKK